ncbi:hypothetical protein CRENBAI_003541, partial [Crenichthys baileyi]
MDEEVTEPDPQTDMPQSEINGDLPGNPYLRDGTLDVVESPAREPLELQYPSEYNSSHQCG